MPRSRPIHAHRIAAVVAVATVAVLGLPGLIGHSSAAVAAGGQVSGTVYQDFNDNGVRDGASGEFGGDSGVAGTTVTATDSTGAVVGTAATAVNGTYTLAVAGAATTAVRIEFTPPNGYRPARVGSNYGTAVQFVTIGATADLGLTQVGEYLSTANPYVVVPSNRSKLDLTTNPNAGQRNLTTDFANLPALWGYPYTSSGNPTTSGRSSLATQGQIGTTWGEANYGTNVALSGAYLRRGTPTGPAGLGAIYATDVAQGVAGNPNAALFVTIPNAGTDPRPNPTPDTQDYWIHDSAAFARVGKIGLGDLETSEDQKTLYAVNLNDRQLYAVPLTPGARPTAIPAAGTPQAIALPLALPGAARGCVQSAVRPGGLGVFLGKLYVTLTCTGPANADLRAYVYAMDEASGVFSQAPVMEVDLTYARPTTGAAGRQAGGDFDPWNDAFNPPIAPGTGARGQKPTPLTSSITFDANGNAQLSIIDRTAMQYGNGLGGIDPADTNIYLNFAGGELLRLCGAPAVGWQLEQNAQCGGLTGRFPNTGLGPGGGLYYENRFEAGYFHGEVLLGSALQLPGFTTIMATAFDPNAINSNGFQVLDNADGTNPRGGTVDSVYTSPTPGGSFGKAGGLGDLTTLVDQAPVEIGNRVWLDTDHNGVQDAGEASLGGVTVNLYAVDGTTLIATAVTDAQGDYYFSSAADTSSTSARYGLALQPSTNYVIRLNNAPDYGGGGPLANLTPTLTTAGNDTALDSNGVPVSAANASANVTTPGAGAADHSFDFGFSPLLSMGNQLWFDTGPGAETNNGMRDPDENPIAAATVQLLDNTGNVLARTTTDANGFYRFDGLQPGDYKVRVAAANFAAGGPMAGYLSSGPTTTTFGATSNNSDKGVNDPNPAANGIVSSVVTLAASNPTGDIDAGATGPGGHGPNGDTADNLTVDFGFVQPFDLTISKTLTSRTTPYQIGQTATFALTPRNNGPADALTGFTVSDKLPAGLTFGLASGTGWTVTDGTGPEITLTYGGAALDAGQSAPPITVTATVNTVTPGSLTNLAVVQPSPDQRTPETIPVGTSPDKYENGSPIPDAGNPSNNDDSAQITVTGPTYSVGNRLWQDTGGGAMTDNGQFDDGESPIADATVELLDQNGTVVATTTTDANGYYRFDGLAAGDYNVRVAASNFAPGAPLANHLSSSGSSSDFNTASNNTDKGVDSLSPATTGITSAAITLGPGAPTGDIDAGATDAGGHGPLGDAYDNVTADFGFVPGLSLGNRLWFDSGTGAGEANNGKFDAGEKPVVGVTVQLLDGGDNPVLRGGALITATTDANGFYRFDGLPAGDYQVRVPPANFASGAPLASWFSSTPTSGNFGAGSNNSDKGVDAPDPVTTGITSVTVTLSTADPTGDGDAGAIGNGDHGPNGDAVDNLTVDFGFTQAFAVGDYVWHDTNANGRQDAGEPPVAGVTVTLLDAAGKPATDLAGNPVAPVKTDAAGHYVFDNLPPGTYAAAFSDLPPGYALAAPLAAATNAGNDSNPNRATGVTTPFQVGPGNPDTTAVQASDGTTTAAQINRSIDAGIVAVLAVGDYVWFDTNRNGVQDATEKPVKGVTVTLLNPDGTRALDAIGMPVPPTTTDVAGHYVFDNLPPGSYKIAFSNLPSGFVPTKQSAAGSTSVNDSNPGATGVTPVFTLALNGTDMRPVQGADGTTKALQINSTINMGIVVPLYAVGDYVWFDQNKNGQHDKGEKPVQGMTVTLYNADGTRAKNYAGTVLAPVKTDTNGHYVFDGLLAGDYYVGFSGVPAGFEFTKQGSGGGSDSDPDSSGRTPVFTLGPDAADLRATTGSDGTTLASSINPTINAGLVASSVPAAPPASDQVNVDSNTSLPDTGADAAGPLQLAALMLLLGVAMVFLGRRRRRTHR